ncbi:LacI family DNA-binding transcriptional regulator, partial [Streptomyces sp. MBT56]|uniref:LacI family DNA-binding transcriptional regulator n=1 Tax=Streptomyces sp. MBT56 TaxID=1488387 RepID=UPI001F2118F6
IKTVSNVVRNAPRVSDATRVRVMEAVGELGYRPNASARRLRTGRSGLIALAVPDLTTPYFAELAHHVAREASDRGFTVLIEETRGDAREELRLATGVGASLLDGVSRSSPTTCSSTTSPPRVKSPRIWPRWAVPASVPSASTNRAPRPAVSG